MLPGCTADVVPCVATGLPAGYVGTSPTVCTEDTLGGYIGRAPGKAPLLKAGTLVGGAWLWTGGA